MAGSVLLATEPATMHNRPLKVALCPREKDQGPALQAREMERTFRAQWLHTANGQTGPTMALFWCPFVAHWHWYALVLWPCRQHYLH